MVREVEKNDGCDVIADPDVRDDCKSLFEGKHSLRGYFDVDLGEIFDGCDNSDVDKGRILDCRITVRRGMRRIEDGRFKEAMLGLNKMLVAMDRDEIETFDEKYPGLIDRVDQVAKIEGTRQPGNILEEGR